MASETLTTAQVKVLERIRVVRDMQVRRLEADYPGCKASRWVNVYGLVVIHKQSRATINALVRKGWLVERPSGGGGPEVLVAGDE